jgi:hypothetical protein
MSGLVAGRRRQPPPITGGSWLGELRMSARLILTSYDNKHTHRSQPDAKEKSVTCRGARFIFNNNNKLMIRAANKMPVSILL